jgi:hypothetical protein
MFVNEYLRLLGLMNLLSNDHVNDAAEEEKNITSHHKYYFPRDPSSRSEVTIQRLYVVPRKK